MIQEDALRILDLTNKINIIDTKIEGVTSESIIAQKLSTIPGFGLVAKSELAGEIGTIDRFRDEAGLALYLGMSPLDNSSGKQKGAKTPKHVNTSGKAILVKPESLSLKVTIPFIHIEKNHAANFVGALNEA